MTIDGSRNQSSVLEQDVDASSPSWLDGVTPRPMSPPLYRPTEKEKRAMYDSGCHPLTARELASMTKEEYIAWTTHNSCGDD